jgi:uncharacterized membrane-anchored protein YitT (DUF2179 family)
MSEEGNKPKDDDELPSTETERYGSLKKSVKLHDTSDINKGKKYKCLYCEKEFSNRQIFIRHVKTHDKNCIIKFKKISRKKK